jgi:ureidoglycolate lyase
MMTVLPVQELTQEAFAPYGSVLDPDRAAPKMKEDIFTFWDGLAEMTIRGRTTVALLEVVARGPQFSKLERHVRTEEVFFALDRPVIILVGAPSTGQDRPDPTTVRAFLLNAGKGVFLKEGAWHWIPVPLRRKARLLVIFRTGTPDEDLEIRDLQETDGISFTIAV